MKKILVSIGLLWFMVGCSGHKQNHEDIVKAKASRLSKTVKPLSSYADFKIEKMVLSSKVKEKEDKVKAAKALEGKINERLSVLINDWKATSKGTGTLLIKPELHSLRIVGGTARFWIGGMAGESNIKMNIKLIDASTGAEIGNPSIDMTASATSGGWSMGATDKNLLNYIADVTVQYLKDNY